MGIATEIATVSADDIVVRGRSVSHDLIGSMDLTRMMVFQATGRVLTDGEKAILDACLIAVMEHGLTPSVIAARLTHLGAPDEMQGAVAAGLLGAGSRYLGSMEQAGGLLQRGVADVSAGRTTVDEWAGMRATEAVRDGVRLPGFGHNIHVPDDPRTPRLFELAETLGTAGAHQSLLRALASELDRQRGSHITVNATGAVAALLSDIDLPYALFRGYSVVARCAGLVGHLVEEAARPLGAEIWELVGSQADG